MDPHIPIFKAERTMSEQQQDVRARLASNDGSDGSSMVVRTFIDRERRLSGTLSFDDDMLRRQTYAGSTSTLPPRNGQGGNSSQASDETGYVAFGGGDEDEYDNEDDLDLEPAFGDSSRRKMTSVGAVLTLLASMLGGGMLTLPFATSKVGIVASLLISMLGALSSAMTYYFLVESSRVTKCNSYHALGKASLGETGKIISMISLILLTLFASMGYLLLLGMLIGEMVTGENSAPPRRLRNFIAVLFALFLTPLSSSRSLHALRHSNMLSVLAAIFLLVSVLWESVKDGKGFHRHRQDGAKEEEIKWFSRTFDDIVYAVPFFIGAYMAHFSILSVHSELIRPTRRRVRNVVVSTVAFAWVLYSAIGVLGYMYALKGTCDSIFSNLPRDVLTVFGRLGLVSTLAFSYPLFIVPCRITVRDLFFTVKGLGDEDQPSEDRSEWEAWFDNDAPRRLLTCILVSISAALACVVPSVGFFVSFIGSTVGTILAIVLPSLFYYRLVLLTSLPGAHRFRLLYKILCIIFIAVAIFVMTVGTWTAVVHASDDACDAQK